MRKIELQVMMQKDLPAYVCVMDPRDVIKLVEIPDNGAVQEFQRPWQEKKVKEIAKYVAGKGRMARDAEKSKNTAAGFLPGCININVKGTLKLIEEGGKKYLEFPETEKEFQDCKGSIEILDGQHRLIAFSKDKINPDFKNDEVYQMCFVIYYQLMTDLKKEVFIVTNDWADKVDKNVMQNMMEALGILSHDDSVLFKLITTFNNEDSSPLKGRVIINGAKLVNGLKLLQIQTILKKSGTYDKLKGVGDPMKIFTLISNYLRAWEQVYNINFKNRASVKTLEKISGLRYIFNIYPSIIEILEIKGKKATTANIVPLLEILKDNLLVDSYFAKGATPNPFSGDSATVKLAKEHGLELKKLSASNQVDIFDV